jgi:hypothetical protein
VTITLNPHSLDGASICDTICPVLQSAGDSGRVEVCLSTPSGKEVWSEISSGAGHLQAHRGSAWWPHVGREHAESRFQFLLQHTGGWARQHHVAEER